MLSPEDRAKINEVTKTFVKAMLAKDAVAMASLYTEDAVLLPPHAPAVKGRAAIKAFLEQFPTVTVFEATNDIVEGRDDLAYVVGSYTMTITPPGAPGPVTDRGKYMEIRWKQPDGNWALAADTFNSDLPAS